MLSAVIVRFPVGVKLPSIEIAAIVAFGKLIILLSFEFPTKTLP